MSDEMDPWIAWLPLETEAVPAAPPTPQEEPVALALPAPGRVLVVDDDELVRWSTARTLRRAGYQVLEAGDADEALICMQEQGARVSLVLSDVIMPKQSGYELGQVLRERWPHVQIVLISGYTPVAMDRHGIETSGFRLLRKPVANLPEVIAQLIGPAQSS
jgi:DNA-binding NtrC family response regulator